jgi:hypothetical protein
MKIRDHRERRHSDEPLEEIRHEAYMLWLKEGCPSGRELDHWLAAKELVRHHRPRVTPNRGEDEVEVRPTEKLVEHL